MDREEHMPPHVPSYTLPYTAKGRWWWYCAWPVVAAVVISVAIGVATPISSDRWSLVLLSLLLASVVLGLWVYSIMDPVLVLLEDRLIYRKRQVLYSAIRRVKVVIEVRQAGVRLDVVAFIQITQGGGEVLRIPIRLFRRADMAATVDIIATRAPNARLDHYAELVRAGRFSARDYI
jgi:hypothetical protein